MKNSRLFLSMLISTSLLGCASNNHVVQNEPVTYEEPSAINFVSALEKKTTIKPSDKLVVMIASSDLSESQRIEGILAENLPGYDIELASDQFKLYGKKAINDLVRSENPPKYLLLVTSNSASGTVNYGTDCYSDGYGTTQCQDNNSQYHAGSIKVMLMDETGPVYQSQFDVEEGGQDKRQVLGLLSSLTESSYEAQVANIIVQDWLSKEIIVPLQRRILTEPDDIVVFNDLSQCESEVNNSCRYSFDKVGYISERSFVEDIDNSYPIMSAREKEQFWANGGQKSYDTYEECHYDGGSKCFLSDEHGKYFDSKEYYF